MPRGGDHRNLQATPPRLNYAKLLLDAMRADSTEAGERFRVELENLYARYKRLVAAIAKYPVSGWPYSVPPPIDHMRNYLDTLMLAPPTPFPRRVLLSDNDQRETERRHKLAGIVSMKVHRRLYAGLCPTDDAKSRMLAADAAAWDWAMKLSREANPRWGPFRESSRLQVRKYLAAVERFCVDWRLSASWAPLALIDHHFMRCLHGADQFLPMITFASWSHDPIPLVVMIPESDPERFAEDRERFTTFRMEQMIRGSATFAVDWTPEPHEQRECERRNGSTCVVLRWEGPGFGGPDAKGVLDYFRKECAHRLGRTLTKVEVRAMQAHLAPQIRDARDKLRERGWRIQSDAPLRQHASWLARRLVAYSTWDEIAFAFTPSGSPLLLSPVVRRACRRYADMAELTLPPPARRLRSHRRA